MSKKYFKTFECDSKNYLESSLTEGMYLAQDSSGLVHAFEEHPVSCTNRIWITNGISDRKVFIYNGPRNLDWEMAVYFNKAEKESHIHSKQIMEYAEDAQVNKFPWMLWEMRHCRDSDDRSWKKLQSDPRWADHMVYRRIPKKKIAIGNDFIEEEYFKDAIVSLKKNGYGDVAKALHSHFELTDIER